MRDSLGRDGDRGSSIATWVPVSGYLEVSPIACREGCGCGGHVTSQRGRTALIMAAWCGRKDMVELLLDRGADMEAKDRVSQARLLF